MCKHQMFTPNVSQIPNIWSLYRVPYLYKSFPTVSQVFPMVLHQRSSDALRRSLVFQLLPSLGRAQGLNSCDVGFIKKLTRIELGSCQKSMKNPEKELQCQLYKSFLHDLGGFRAPLCSFQQLRACIKAFPKTFCPCHFLGSQILGSPQSPNKVNYLSKAKNCTRSNLYNMTAP